MKTALIWRKNILIYVQQMYNSMLWVRNKYYYYYYYYYYLLHLGCYPVAVVTLQVNKHEIGYY